MLWFDEDFLGERPLKQFDEFLCKSLAAGGYGAPVSWSQATILGPEQSITLLAMANEVDDDRSDGHCPELARPQFFVYSATVADEKLVPRDFRTPCNVSRSCLSDYLHDRKQVSLHRRPLPTPRSPGQ